MLPMQGTRLWSMVRELDPACCNGDLAQPNMYIRKKYQCSTYYLSLYNWERAKSFSSYPSYNTDLPLPWKEENQISTQTFSKSLTFTIWVETENHKIDSRGPEWRVGDTEHRCERREELASAPFLALTSCISLGKPLNLSEPTFLDL